VQADRDGFEEAGKPMMHQNKQHGPGSSRINFPNVAADGLPLMRRA